jgi:hypothetical protein
VRKSEGWALLVLAVTRYGYRTNVPKVAYVLVILKNDLRTRSP